MGVIQDNLKSVEKYLTSISRNTMKGWYEIEVGVYSSWVFDSNKDIKCDVLVDDADKGKLLKISPKSDKITVDDLIRFVELIIETNERIAEKEKEFAKEMEKMKEILENKAKSFYDELDSLKDSSFKNLTINLEKKNLNKKDSQDEKPKKTRGRPPKKSETINVDNGLDNEKNNESASVKIIKTDED